MKRDFAARFFRGRCLMASWPEPKTERGSGATSPGQRRAGILVRCAVFVLFVALAVWSALRHEAWRDEAQAWLIARDLPVDEIVHQMRYEGTPALWHLMLVPLAKGGLPFGAQAVLHLLIGVAATGLLLFKAPLPWWLRVPLAFSVFFSYEYVVVARNYGLTALLVFLIAGIHAVRLQRPWLYGLLVALLANTNVHSMAAALALAAWFAWDAVQAREGSLRVRAAAALAVCGILAAIVQIGTGQANHLVGNRFDVDLGAPVSAIRNAWLPGLPLYAAVPALLITAGLAALLWRSARIVFWVLVLSLAGPLVIFALRHSGGLRHHGLILVYAVFALWLAWPRLAAAGHASRLRRLAVAMAVVVAAGLPASLRAHLADSRGLFSGAPAMAKYIKDNDLQDRFMVAHPSAPTSAVLPWLAGVRLWYADVQAAGTFITWDREYAAGRSMSIAAAAERARALTGWVPGSLLLTNEAIEDPARHGLRLRHEVIEGVYTDFGECLYLYEAGP